MDRVPAVRLTALAFFVLLLAATLAATLAPIGWRPKTGHLVFERTLPFVALGLSLAVAMPRRLPLVLTGVMLIALGSEYVQTLIPTRHSRLDDAYEKAFGAALGVLIAEIGRKALSFGRLQKLS